MTLASVHPGDIIRVAGSYGIVVEKEYSALVVQWIGTTSTRRVRAVEVEAHWRRSKK